MLYHLSYSRELSARFREPATPSAGPTRRTRRDRDAAGRRSADYLGGTIWK